MPAFAAISTIALANVVLILARNFFQADTYCQMEDNCWLIGNC
jgi:hypothetical protein